MKLVIDNTTKCKKHIWKTTDMIEVDPEAYEYEATCNGYDSERRYYGRIAKKQKCLNCGETRFHEEQAISNSKREPTANGVIAIAVIAIITAICIYFW